MSTCNKFDVRMIFGIAGECEYLLNGICDDAIDTLSPNVLKYWVKTENYNCNPKRQSVTCFQKITIELRDVPISPMARKDYVITRHKNERFFVVSVVCVS